MKKINKELEQAEKLKRQRINEQIKKINGKKADTLEKIGRASCRERVSISV